MAVRQEQYWPRLAAVALGEPARSRGRPRDVRVARRGVRCRINAPVAANGGPDRLRSTQMTASDRPAIATPAPTLTPRASALMGRGVAWVPRYIERWMERWMDIDSRHASFDRAFESVFIAIKLHNSNFTNFCFLQS